MLLVDSFVSNICYNSTATHLLFYVIRSCIIFTTTAIEMTFSFIPYTHSLNCMKYAPQCPNQTISFYIFRSYYSILSLIIKLYSIVSLMKIVIAIQFFFHIPAIRFCGYIATSLLVKSIIASVTITSDRTIVRFQFISHQYTNVSIIPYIIHSFLYLHLRSLCNNLVELCRITGIG